MIGVANFRIYGMKLYTEINGVQRKFYYIFPEPLSAESRQPRDLRKKFLGEMHITLYSGSCAVAQVQEAKDI